MDFVDKAQYLLRQHHIIGDSPFRSNYGEGFPFFPACKSANPIFVCWFHISLFATTFVERGESHEKNINRLLAPLMSAF